jgi:PTH1 family peptidyl-tRNA hydrolase
MHTILLVGLGNPGTEYEKTRHNIGFRIVDQICEEHRFGSFRLKDFGLLAEGHIGDTKVYALKPLTFMNRSGIAIKAASQFFKIPVENIIVCHDELALDFGKLKLKHGGGHAGHNGIRDTDRHMGPNYWRLRFGVGHPGDRNHVQSHVLNRFSKEEEQEIAPLLADIASAAPLLIKKDVSGFLNTINNSK